MPKLLVRRIVATEIGHAGIHRGAGAEAFASAVGRIHGYQVPDSPDTVQELTCVVPNYDGSHPSRIRFFLRQAGVVFDLHRPGLGELVVANFTPSYGFDVPYRSDVAPDTVRNGIMQLPERLEALAVELR